MLYIREEHLEVDHENDRRIHFGDTGVVESAYEDIGKLFRELQREHGRCTGKVFIDTKAGDRQHIGWVFEKKDEYTDTHESFIHETWITVHEDKPTVETTYDYCNLKEGD